MTSQTSPLLRAIASGDSAAVARLIAEDPPLASAPAGLGATRQESTEYFLENIQHNVYAGDTPLHIAGAAYQWAIAKSLLAAGADVRARNRRGAEPLHYASDGRSAGEGGASIDQARTIELLLDAGADPDAADQSGVAALHRAVRTRSTDAVRTLLGRGADPRRPNGSGSTPLHLAVQTTGRSGSGSASAKKQQREIIQLLLTAGARLSDRGSRGRSVVDSIRAGWILELIRADELG